MKRLTLVIALLLLLPVSAYGQAANSWFPTGGGGKYLKPVVNTYGLLVPGLATSTTGCLGVTSGGWIFPSGSACGSGSGSGADGLATTSLTASYPVVRTATAASVNFSFAGLSTTSPWTIGELAYVASGNQVTSVATGTVSSAGGITSTENRYVIGGNLLIECDVASAAVPGCLSAADWTTFDAKENVLTFGDALTRTGDDIDFDGGATPAGDLGGTWANPSVDDDSHAHTGATLSAITEADFSDSDWGDITVASNVASVEDNSHAHTSGTISGLDISADTDLTAGDGLTLNDDDLDCDTASGSVFGCLSTTDWTTFNNKESALTFNSPLSRSVNTISFLFNTFNTWTAHNIFPSIAATNSTTTNATTTALDITNLLTFNGVTGNSWDDFCTTITGGSGLCDGNDATGSGGAPEFTVTPLNTYSTTTLATTTSLWTQGVFFSSSTRAFSVFPYASSTVLTATEIFATGIHNIPGDDLEITTEGDSIFVESGSDLGLLAASDFTLQSGDGLYAFENGTDTFTNGIIDFSALSDEATIIVPDIGGTTDTLCFETLANCGGGSGTPGGSGSELQYRTGASSFGGVLNSAALSNGNVGIGSTTPWALLSLSSSTPDYLTPLFAISTSSHSSGDLLGIFATSSTLASQAPRVSGSLSLLDSGVRIVIGAFQKYTGLVLDQLNINGRINTGEWFLLECTPNGFTSASADTSGVCPGWKYDIDTTGILSLGVNGGTRNSFFFNQAAANAATGAGLFSGSAGSAGGGIYPATSTPVLEVSMTGSDPVGNGNSGTSTVRAGFVDINTTGTTFEVNPANGCFIEAATTSAAWTAVCVSSNTRTTVASPFATTSRFFIKWRVEMDANDATFYYQTATTTLTKFATISSNYPVTARMTAGVYINVPFANAPALRALYVQWIRLWERKTLFTPL